MLITQIILIGLLAFNAYHDFKYRNVFVFSLIALLADVLVYSAQNNSLVKSFNYVFINILLIGGIFILAYLIFTLMQKKFINIKHVIGAGDILFLLVVCFLFSPANFILFVILSFCFSLFFYFLQSRETKSKHIPLIGTVSIPLMVLYLFNIFVSVDFYSDSWLLSLII